MPTVLLVLLASLTRADQRIAVLDFGSRNGVPIGLAQAAGEQLAVDVRREANGFSVLSSDDMRNLLSVERQKQQLGCADSSCMAEIGGALGAQQIVVGALAIFGDTYIITIRRFDVVHATVLREVSGRLAMGAERELPDRLAALTKTLFLPVEAEADLASRIDVTWDSDASRAHDRTLAVGLTVGAGAAAVTCLTTALLVGVVYNPEFAGIRSGANTTTRAQAEGDRTAATASVAVSVVSGIVGSVLGVGALLAW